MAGLEKIFKERTWYQKCGVIIRDLCHHDNRQLGLLAEPPSDENVRQLESNGHAG